MWLFIICKIKNDNNNDDNNNNNDKAKVFDKA